MIAYLEDNDVTVDVPDDISEEELNKINNNFSDISQPLEESSVSPEGNNDQQKNIIKTGFDFYNSHIQPVLDEITPSGPYKMLGPAGALFEPGKGEAFFLKGVESASFGLLKPQGIYGEEAEKAYKEHPIFAGAGELTGSVGSLLATGGALRALGVADKIEKFARPTAKLAGYLPRFIAPSIQTSATFGTQTFIKETVKAFQDGEVDIVRFGTSVLKASVLGGLFGGISGISNAPTAITSAGGVGVSLC